MRVAIIENSTCTNIIEVEDIATVFRVQVPIPDTDPPEFEWVLPDGITLPHLVASDTATIGDAYAGGLFIKPPAPPPAPPPVPQSLTPLQARRVLRRHNKLALVEQAVAAAGEEAQEAWEFANAIQRDDPLVAQLMLVVGLSPGQVDALFVEGATL